MTSAAAQSPPVRSSPAPATVADIMQRSMTTIDQYDHVAAASYLMKHTGTTALPVLDGQHSDQPIGCITQADITRAMAHGMDPDEIRIRDLIAPSHGRSA